MGPNQTPTQPQEGKRQGI